MAMKESGIEWVGLIPNDWKIAKNNRLFNISKQLVNENWKNTQLLSLTKSGIIEKNINDGGGKQPESFGTYQYVEKDDIVLCLFDIDVSAVFSDRSKYDGMISPAYRVMKCTDAILPVYAKWWFEAVNIGRYYLIYTKSLRKTIDADGFGNILTVVPPLSEQQAIADYLDETRSKIDEIIAEAKASIDEYKELKQSVIFEAVTKGLDKNVEMKDSGIEWIGKIPVDWNIAKISRVAWTTSGATPLRSKETEYYDNAVIRWVRTLDLNNGHVTDSSEKITETALKNSSCSIMPVKTVCVAMYGGAGTIGKSGILEVECATNQAICSIVSDKKVLNPDYLHYVIMAVRKYWMKYAVGTRKDPNINQQIIAQMRIPIPQLSKQDIIVNHLDKVTDKCDSLIAEKESLINDLEAYKKSLIYEVVTGKRRVV